MHLLSICIIGTQLWACLLKISLSRCSAGQVEEDAAHSGRIADQSSGHLLEADLRRLHNDVLQAKEIASALTKKVNESQKPCQFDEQEEL